MEQHEVDRYTVRAHIDEDTVDFKGWSLPEAHGLAKEICVNGVWADPRRYPSHRVLYVELIKES